MSAVEAGDCGRRRLGAGRQRDSRRQPGTPGEAHECTQSRARRLAPHLAQALPPHARAHVRTYTSTDPDARRHTHPGNFTDTHQLLAPREPTVRTFRCSLTPPGQPLQPVVARSPRRPLPRFLLPSLWSLQGPSTRPVAMATRALSPRSRESPHAPPPQRYGGGGRASAPASVGAGPEGWGLEIRSDPGSRQPRRSDPPASLAWDVGVWSPAGESQSEGGDGGLRLWSPTPPRFCLCLRPNPPPRACVPFSGKASPLEMHRHRQTLYPSQFRAPPERYSLSSAGCLPHLNSATCWPHFTF